MSIALKRAMIDPDDRLSISAQCELLGLPRSSYYYQPLEESPLNLELMGVLDRIYLRKPYFGRPRLTRAIRELGYPINSKRIGRLMKIMGIRAIFPEPRTTIQEKEHKKYPYLLRGLEIIHPNQVWCSDITYVPMQAGFLYLVAIMDWYSRYVISWRISNALDKSFCIEALEEALDHGKPEIFNSDKGGQYTSPAFTGLLEDAKSRISMTARGCWDNLMIERLWRTVKYEHIYLHSYQNGWELERGLRQYFQEYNYENPHSSLNMAKPYELWK
ncbi:IS3 family transposase [Pontibacter sp. G13]|uniref:IS3 family transposase n=1 Tax=Pontibacter sp. G13 TaxID=3074898 RepID=UPI00288B8E72|nr:IS3 family transposase [Pontibacter sp. G13]WNJ17577.1 IS3 family transposase [Pontibacter sp. G13]